MLLSSFRWVWRLGLVTACLSGTMVEAQNDAISRRMAIDGMYPVMLAALEAKSFGRARNICDQAIMWEPQNPVHHYNLACIEAQAGGTRLPYAWGALELAIVLGFDDAAHLKSDPDLAPLRNDPRFAGLIRKMAFNVSAPAARSSITIADPRSNPTAPGTPAPGVERPAPAAFKDDLPVGLYLMDRYHSSTQAHETSVWYFAPDHVVHRNLENGFSKADLVRHTGPRGTAVRTGRSLEITWSDGRQSASRLERDGEGFTWNMGIFTPVVAFENPSDAAGIYEGAESVAAGGDNVSVAQRLELHADGTFRWAGVSFDCTESGSIRISAGSKDLTIGHWELSGYSLILTNAEGVVLRRIVFPQDDEITVIKPDRMFFGGLMYKRRP
jgi:hypothetical protein